MKSLRLFILTAILLTTSCLTQLFAIPADPLPKKITQPDGSEITVILRGDEFYHYKTTVDGYLLIPDKKGILTYAKQDAAGKLISTNVKANNINKRTASERKLVQTLSSGISLNKTIQRQRLARISQTPDMTTPSKAYPLKGTPRSLVILVNFADRSFIIPSANAAFSNLLNQDGYPANGGTGSANNYFKDNSKGVFDPKFDVVGPFTLPQPLDFYGKENTNGDDANAIQMIVDACKAADANGIDFSQYDTDNNGVIDNVFVYFAGYNEAEHGPVNTVWPHRWGIYPTDLYSGGNYAGTSASVTFDGKRICDYACSSELRGSSGSNMCGIGTFCHEFSHVLGLPDFYATNGATHHTLSNWDVMDTGSYLNLGRTPPAYSAYERFFLKWLTPTELKTAQDVRLDTLTTSNKAYLFTQYGTHNLNSTNPSPAEFFLIENRQKKGWDTFLPGHGLLVTRIFYNATTWRSNGPNNDPATMGVDIMEADGQANTSSLASDVFPGTSNIKNYFPALRSGTFINKPLTNITETNGIISLRFMKDIPQISTTGVPTAFSTVQGTPADSQTVVIGGSKLFGTVQLSFENGTHFQIKKENTTSWGKNLLLFPKDSVLADTKIYIRYNPTEPSYSETHSEKLILKTAGANKSISMNGTSTRAIYVTAPVAKEASDTTSASFVANWDTVFDATGYYLTVYNLSEGQSNQTQGFDNGVAKLPGWTIIPQKTSTTYFGAKIPSVMFSSDKEYIETEEYLLPASSLSFFIRSYGGNNGGFVVEAQNSKKDWVRIDSIAVVSTLNEKNKTYLFSDSENYNRFRFTYLKGSGMVTFDDVTVTFNKQLNFITYEKWTDANTDTLTNLAPYTEYFYKVRATDKSDFYENITDPSNTISVKTLSMYSAAKFPYAGQLRVKADKNGNVTVDLPKTESKLMIYNSIGQLVRTIAPEKQTIVIKDLPQNGLYILKSDRFVAKIAL